MGHEVAKYSQFPGNHPIDEFNLIYNEIA